MGKRTLLFSVCFLSLLIAPYPSNAEKDESNSKTPIQQPQEQIENELSKVTQQKLQVADEIDKLTRKIEEINQQIKDSNEKIAENEEELKDINRKIDGLNQEEKRITSLLQNRKEEFKERVSSYYRTKGQMSFLNVIFSVNSFGEFIDHFIAYDSIVNNDRKFIEKYIADQNKVSTIKGKIEVLQKTSLEEKAKLEAIKANQEKDKKDKVALSSLLEEKKKQLEREEQEKLLALQMLQDNGEEIWALLSQNGDLPKESYALINSIIIPFVPDAQRIDQEKGIPASITLGQIILESSGRYNGLSGLAFEAKNLFGIKGTGTAGSVYWNTTEYVNGEKVTVKAQFAKYTTYYDSMSAHADLLLTPRYQKYLKDVTDIIDYANGLFSAGYATDPDYAKKLLKIIYQYQLWKIDV